MSEPLTSHERAKRLIDETKELGMDCPSAQMIAETIQDAEFDTINFPRVIADRHNIKSQFVQDVLGACGRLAERLAGDMDHDNKDHSLWYKFVKKVRKHLNYTP